MLTIDIVEQNDTGAHEINIHALARLGELLKDIEKAAGARGRPGPGRGKRGSKVEPRLSGPATLAQLGVGKKESSVAQALADLPAKTRTAIAKRETTLAKVRRERKAKDTRRRAAEQFDRWADGPIDVPDHAASILRSADPRWSLDGMR